MFTRIVPYLMAANLCLMFFMSNLALSQPVPAPPLVQKPGTVQAQPTVDAPSQAPIPAVLVQPQTSHNTCPTPCPDRKAPEPWFLYTVLMVVLFGILFCLGAVKVALDKHKTWSLADALSEEVDVAAEGTTPTAGAPPPLPAATAVVTTLHASSSRLIAFLGSIVILFLFLGFGLVAIYDFATTGTLPSSTSSVKDYLLTGLALFAPYAVNKFSSLFEGLAPKKT